MISTLDRSGHGVIYMTASVLAVLMRINHLQDAENLAPQVGA
jgi:hypothetical protein